MDLHGKLATTVVGSFPLESSVENMERSLNDQIKIRIDYPCYGQLDDMNLMFLEPLEEQKCGLEIRDGQCWIVDVLKVPKEPVALGYLSWAQNYLKNNDLEEWITKIKIPVTGPYTLSSVTNVTDTMTALQSEDMIEIFAEIVQKIAKFYDEAGAAIITIDEPVLNFAIAEMGVDPERVVDNLNTAFKGIKNAVRSTHVCGDIFTVAELLLQTDSQFLDHEFKQTPTNLKAYSRSDLEKYDKMIGLGSIISAVDPLMLHEIKKGERPVDDVIESVDEVEKFILGAADRFGIENLVIDPDCGFGGLKRTLPNDQPYLMVMKKLENMVEAVKKLRKEYL